MKKSILLLLLLFLPYVYLAIIWPGVPDIVPMHYRWDGKIDRYGSRKELLLLIAALTIVILIVYLLITNMHRIDLKRAVAENKDPMQKIALAVAVFMVGVQVWLIYSVQRGAPDFSLKFILIAICLLLAAIGNYMPNLKPNYFAGIRLSWTLENEVNWRKTHYLAGKFWFGGGLLSAVLFLALPYKTALILFIILMLILIFIPAIYSYRLFKRSKQ